MEKHDFLPSAYTHIDGMHSFMNMSYAHRELLIGKTHGCDIHSSGYCLAHDPDII